METFSWGVCLLHCGSTTVAFLQRPQSTSPSCSESGQFLNTSHPSRSCPLGLLLSSLPCLSRALCPDVHFSYSPTLPSLMHSPPVSLPPSSLTTPEFISLSLALSLSLSPHQCGSKKGLVEPREGSKALNDGIEFWQNKFGLLKPSEKLNLRQCRF